MSCYAWYLEYFSLHCSDRENSSRRWSAFSVESSAAVLFDGRMPGFAAGWSLEVFVSTATSEGFVATGSKVFPVAGLHGQEEFHWHRRAAEALCAQHWSFSTQRLFVYIVCAWGGCG